MAKSEGAVGMIRQASTAENLRHEIQRLQERLTRLQRAEAYLVANPELGLFVDDLRELGLR